MFLSAALSVATLAAAPAQAGEPVNVLILKEQGVGSAAHAQQYVDKLMTVAAEQNGWSGAVGKYQTRRGSAESWIGSNKPHYGILSLGAFLGMRSKHSLEVIGKVEVAQSGGRQYHVISKSEKSLAGCKGKTLASNHADDAKFVDKVISGGSFGLSDFQLVKTRRPMQTVKAVTSGEAVCALVDDAQFESMKKVEGGAALASVWKSKMLPPMVVVAFPSAPSAEKSTFKRNLAKLCTGSGKQACKEVGIKSLKGAGEGDYKAAISSYGG
jgi:hypothetical protein